MFPVGTATNHTNLFFVGLEIWCTSVRRGLVVTEQMGAWPDSSERSSESSLLLLLLLLLSSLVDELSTSGVLPALLPISATDVSFVELGCPCVVSGLLETLLVPLLALLSFLEQSPKLIKRLCIPTNRERSCKEEILKFSAALYVDYWACK